MDKERARFYDQLDSVLRALVFALESSATTFTVFDDYMGHFHVIRYAPRSQEYIFFEKDNVYEHACAWFFEENE